MLHTNAKGHWPFGSGKEDFYHIWAWRPSWSCDPDAQNKLSFSWPMEAPHEIWLWLAQWFLEKRDGQRMDGQQTDDGACLYYKLINEPKGSGELKNQFWGLTCRTNAPINVSPQRGVAVYPRELFFFFEIWGLIPYPWVTNLCQKKIPGCALKLTHKFF